MPCRVTQTQVTFFAEQERAWGYGQVSVSSIEVVLEKYAFLLPLMGSTLRLEATCWNELTARREVEVAFRNGLHP